MGGIFSRLFSILAIGFLFCMIPFYFLGKTQMDSEQSYLNTCLTEFFNFSREEQGITKQAYEKLQQELFATGAVYEISMTHAVPIRGFKVTTTSSLKKSELKPVSDNVKKAVSLKVIPEDIFLDFGEMPDIQVFLVYEDGSMEELNDWDSDFKVEQLGVQYVSVTYKELFGSFSVIVSKKLICEICNKEYRIQEEADCPFCMEELMDLAVYLNETHIMLGTVPNFTVIAFYQDGRAEAVEAYESSFQNNLVGDQIVNISYKGITKEIQVHVLPKIKTCSICKMKYEESEGDICESCSRSFKTVKFKLYTPEVAIGENPKITVLIEYLDGKKEEREKGISLLEYSSDLLGSQKIKAVFEGYTSEFLIMVKEKKQYYYCGEGHPYFSGLEGGDSGCPICLAAEEKKENILYYEHYTTKDIDTTLQKVGKYEIKEGEYFSITIYQITPSYAKQYVFSLFSTQENMEKTVAASFGGEF